MGWTWTTSLKALVKWRQAKVVLNRCPVGMAVCFDIVVLLEEDWDELGVLVKGGKDED